MDQTTLVTIADKPLVCQHCGNNRFIVRNWQLNTTKMAFLDLEWLNDSATNYVCSRCGRIEWFTDAGHQSFSASYDGDTDCLSCGEHIPHGKTVCPKCGWTYKK